MFHQTSVSDSHDTPPELQRERILVARDSSILATRLRETDDPVYLVMRPDVRINNCSLYLGADVYRAVDLRAEISNLMCANS